ncbi:kinase-like protein [Gigaspora margarita]|uniref:Kinase-like protein n=1 Tax=Gigaspora margarita TaxID=4874 RepID=A0A8H4AJJ1_GIGMA|nr:kinase-like protein [Gigaspora margarita]
MDPMFQYSEKLELFLKDYNIKSYDYSQFSDIRPIERGGFAFVYSTVFQEKTYALKCLNNNLHLDVKAFKLLICEKQNRFKFEWKKLIKCANELTLGLEYLHKKGIIHRDLHSKNILINEDKILIADFGISKHVNDASTTSAILGMPAYIEPQCFFSLGKPSVMRNQTFIA